MNHIREYIEKVSKRCYHANYILLDCSKVVSLDQTSIKVLGDIIIDAKLRDQEVIFYKLLFSLYEKMGTFKESSYRCNTNYELRELFKKYSHTYAKNVNRRRNTDDSIEL